MILEWCSVVYLELDDTEIDSHENMDRPTEKEIEKLSLVIREVIYNSYRLTNL
jgi:hypothetical protein